MRSSIPRPGMLAQVRNRFAMVRTVEEEQDKSGRISRLVEVEYLDHALPAEDQVLWELESTADVLEPRTPPKVSDTHPMALREFDAVLRAARWTALLPYQPVKAGIRPVVAPLMGAVQVEDYQLVPLARALDMPRVQLGLFDDVGLGKTVEAGLLIAELIRRRRIRRVLVLCPAWLRKQWQDELKSKFGLSFDFIDREQTQSLRRNMGMDANPWRTFPRVITSFGYLSQPDVLQQFLAASKTDPRSPMLPWDLLIVDEVHNAMPSAHGSDSRLCSVLRDISRLFEHRIFLSATPHPGFTRSYTGLLEMLDPVRITKSDTLNAAARDRARKIVVRRLKDEINDHDRAEGRTPRFAGRKPEDPLELKFGPEELELIRAVDRFRSTLKGALRYAGPGTRTAGNFLLETLAKRLLSCPFTFADSWGRFRLGLYGEEQADEGDVDTAAQSALEEIDDDAESESRTALATELAGMWARSLKLQEAANDVDRALIALGLNPEQPNLQRNPIRDARYERLKELIREHLGPSSGWANDERLIVFSEYRTTTDYLLRRLREDFPGEPIERFSTLFGGLSEDEREAVKAAFNDAGSPVRVLVATDAAGEGGNLQESARLLLHFDLPWNPSRIDQRNGRLDRHGQAREVRIYHFDSAEDAATRFLSRLFGKIDRRRADLGAVSKLFQHAFHQRFIEDVVEPESLFEFDEKIEKDLDDRLEKAKEKIKSDIPRDAIVGQELREEFESFCQQIDFNPTSLRETLEVALGMGVGRFTFAEEGSRGKYRFPSQLPPRFAEVIRETMSTERGATPALQFDLNDQLVERDGRAVFRPPSDAVLMHLGHPLVQRSIAALARARFPGTEESKSASRWVCTRGPVTPGADADIYIAVEELALNDLRELVHHWVRVVKFPVKNGQLLEPVMELVPSRENVVEYRDGHETAKEIWEEVEHDLRQRLDERSRNLSKDLVKHLNQDLSRARQDQETLFKERRDEIERQLSREASALRRELEEVRDSHASLFDPDEIERISKNIGDIEAEVAARREHYKPLLEYLEQENKRIQTETIPKRHALRDEVQIFPITVEVRLP